MQADATWDARLTPFPGGAQLYKNIVSERRTGLGATRFAVNRGPEPLHLHPALICQRAGGLLRKCYAAATTSTAYRAVESAPRAGARFTEVRRVSCRRCFRTPRLDSVACCGNARFRDGVYGASPMKVIATPPRTREQFLRRIAQEYDGISGRLKLIAQSVDQNREELGHMGIRMFAQHCGVHPSAVVRFAHYFGFSGYSDMRALFRGTHVQDVSVGSQSGSSDNEPDALSGEHWQFADAHLVRSIMGLQNLRRTLNRPEFARAVNMLERAEIVWIAGANRAFPVAVHLEHALRQAGKRVGHLGAFESLTVDQARAVRAGDLVVVISVSPCAQEIAEIVRYSLKQDAAIIAITDSRLSPVGRAATVSLIVRDSVNSGFDFITAATSLVQCFCAVLISSYVEHRPDVLAF